jgi:hypothetical protein
VSKHEAEQHVLRNGASRTRRSDAGSLHALRQMRRGLPEREAGRHFRCGTRRNHHRDHRHHSKWRWSRSVTQMGAILHAQWRMHQGVRRRRQSALSARDGARFDRKGRARIAAAPAPGNRKISRPRPRRHRAVQPAARSKAAGAAGSEISFGGNAGRASGLRVLHRLQCIEDAAHCLAGDSTSWMRFTSLTR